MFFVSHNPTWLLYTFVSHDTLLQDLSDLSTKKLLIYDVDFVKDYTYINILFAIQMCTALY